MNYYAEVDLLSPDYLEEIIGEVRAWIDRAGDWHVTGHELVLIKYDPIDPDQSVSTKTKVVPEWALKSAISALWKEYHANP